MGPLQNKFSFYFLINISLHIYACTVRKIFVPDNFGRARHHCFDWNNFNTYKKTNCILSLKI